MIFNRAHLVHPAMYIVAIAWIYVVLMMSITEESIIAGVVTFALYGILPLTIILYIMGAPQRKRQRLAAEAAARAQRDTREQRALADSRAVAADPAAPEVASPGDDPHR